MPCGQLPRQGRHGTLVRIVAEAQAQQRVRRRFDLLGRGFRDRAPHHCGIGIEPQDVARNAAAGSRDDKAAGVRELIGVAVEAVRKSDRARDTQNLIGTAGQKADPGTCRAGFGKRRLYMLAPPPRRQGCRADRC